MAVRFGSIARGEAVAAGMRLVRDVLQVVIPGGGFYAYAQLLDRANWGRGSQRAALLGVGAALLLILVTRRIRPLSSKRLVPVFAIAVLILVGLSVTRALGSLGGLSPTVDIGTTTVASVELWLAGENPYTEQIDPAGERVNPGGRGLGFFGGFKYGPVMTLAYLPGVWLAGSDGYLVTNLVLLLLTAAVAGYWAGGAGVTAGLGAAALVLLPSFVRNELFGVGVNDLVPVVLGTLALALRSRGRVVGPGVLMGLSIAAKPLPGAVFALVMLGMRGCRWRCAGATALTAMLAYLPAVVRSPQELLAGLVMFNLARPADSTSLVFGASELVQRLAGIAAMLGAAVLATAGGWRWADREPSRVASVAAGAVAVLLVGSGHIHRNYLLWLVPLVAVALAANMMRTSARERSSSTS